MFKKATFVKARSIFAHHKGILYNNLLKQHFSVPWLEKSLTNEKINFTKDINCF